MARYIDAEYVLECMKHYIEDIGYEERINKRYSKITVEDAMALVEDAPTADVALVKHAHWKSVPLKQSKFEMVKCSICGWGYGIAWASDINYCEHCGAKMDGGEESG